MSEPTVAPGFPRLTYLRIRNYRALRDVELRDLTPLTVFIGPNGSGKSTVLDALAFLAEAVSGNLQQAWEKRNRFAGMRTRGSDGPIEFEAWVAWGPDSRTLQYLLEIEERNSRVYVIRECVYIAGIQDDYKPIFFAENFEFNESTNVSIAHGRSEGKDDRITEFEIKADPVFKTLKRGAFIYAFAEFENDIQRYAIHISSLLTSYRYLHLTDDHLKGYSDAGLREKLSANGDNLPNVLYYLHTKHPEALARITAQLRRWVPGLADIVTEITSDERLLLRFKDAPFEKPLPAQYMSDGTMRLAALLTLLYEPNATGLLGLEEPENELHPRLLPRLAEELIKASETRQLLVATHSPFLLDALEPEQVWILHRGEDGYTQATRTADIPQVKELVEDGSPLGYLWTSNFFRFGDPLAPRTPAAL
jgi:predicted ATPase